MARLSRVLDGGVLFEKFEYGITPIWSVTTDLPERVVAGYDGGVIMKHGGLRASMLTTSPIGDFVFQAEVIHEPKTLADIGGLMIQADADSRIELQTYYNGLLGQKPQYFRYIKVSRVGDRYSIYASIDGDLWEPIGATLLSDCHQIGFFIDGPETDLSTNFFIKDVAMYKSNYFTMLDVPHGNVIRIKDDTGTVIAERDTETMLQTESKVLFDMTKTMFPIKSATIQVLDDGNVTSEINNVDISGGDVYSYQYDIQVLMNNDIIDSAYEQDIGYVSNSGQEFQLAIINKDKVIMTGKKLSVARYSDYFRGSDFADIALNSDGILGEFKQAIDLPNILPDQRIELIVRVTRDASSEAPFFVNKYKFKVILE